VPEVVDVVVTLSEAPDEAAISAMVTVVEVDERVPADADVADVVDNVPGAKISRLGGLGDYSAVSIRGSSFRQVEVFLDGVPLNPDGASAINLSELPLRSFSRVEVYRGGGPPELGANAMGGVIHLVTADSPPGARAAFSGGSLHTYAASASAGLSGRVSGLPTDGFAAVNGFVTGGQFAYFSDRGTPFSLGDDRRLLRMNNDHRRLSGHARWRLGHPGLRFTAVTSWSAVDEGVPGPASRPTRSVRYAATRGLASVGLQSTGGPVTARCSLWGLGFGEAFEDRSGEIGLGRQSTRDMTWLAGLRGGMKWAPTRWLTTHTNLQARFDLYRSVDQLSNATSPERRRLVAKGSVGASGWWLPAAQGAGLAVTATVSLIGIDNAALNEVDVPDGRPDARFEAMPRVGVVARPTSWLTLKANGGRYVRPPDLIELFGDRGALVGNPDLVAESGWSLDAGFRTVSPVTGPATGWAEVAWFLNEGTDHIVYVQNAQGVSVPANLGQTRVIGVESAGYAHLFKLFEAGYDLTWTWSRNLSERHPATTYAQLPGVPALEASAHVAVHWRRQIRAGYRFSFTDGTYWDATNWFLAAPRAFHGLFASVRLGSDHPRRGIPVGPWLEVNVRNLTDRIGEVVVRNPLDPADEATVVQPVTDFVGYPLPGRTVMVTLTFEEPR